MCERLWRRPEAKECLCLAILAQSSDVGYNRRPCQVPATACVPVLGACSRSPSLAAVGWAWGLLFPAACGPALLGEGRHRARCAGLQCILHSLPCPLCVHVLLPPVTVNGSLCRIP